VGKASRDVMSGNSAMGRSISTQSKKKSRSMGQPGNAGTQGSGELSGNKSTGGKVSPSSSELT